MPLAIGTAQELVPANDLSQHDFRQAADRPTGDDFAATSLRNYVASVRRQYGDDYRDVPLDVKADLFEWAIWRYHLTSYSQVQNRVSVPESAGRRPSPTIGPDTSTWNGALLAALSYKYAVTRDPQTLAHIVVLLNGLRFYTEVTGRPGCYARSVVPEGTDVRRNASEKFGLYRHRAPDGTNYVFLGGPAKGGYNQLAGGYAALLMFAYDDLPPEKQGRVRRDVSQMVMHVLRGDYKIADVNGQPTPHGDMTPIIASVGVPFNGQVAYQIVALGHYFPNEDVDAKKRIADQFYRLREKRHAYYKDPRKSLIRPQRVGDNPLVKGMNDRNHVTGAAYTGLALEVDHRHRMGQTLNRTFMYRLGRTMYWSMRNIGHQRNALCNFMWAGMLSDPARMDMIVHRREQAAVRKQIERGLADGVQQLRCFRLDRFHRPGQYVETKQLQWVDQQMPDDYIWKANPKAVFRPNGPPTNIHTAAIDYLAAYWLFRYYELDKHPAVADHRSVL